jgi:hypothetical protein
MSSLRTAQDIRRAAGELGIDEAAPRDVLDWDKLAEFALGMVDGGRSIETVARSLGITEDKIDEERSRQASNAFQRYLLEIPLS